MAALDEAGADLRGDQALALEDAYGVAAEADEQRGDDVVRRERFEERLELDRLVLGLVREAERRPDGDALVGGFDACSAAGVDGAPGLRGERLQALADVFAAYVAGHRPSVGQRAGTRPRTGSVPPTVTGTVPCGDSPCGKPVPCGDSPP